jgi:hypothetical protein
VDADEQWRQKFLAALARMDAWMDSNGIAYRVIGSLAVTAYIDEGRSLDFDRDGAADPTQRMPDVDLLVPRDRVALVKSYAASARNAELPIKLDTVAAEVYIDFRPANKEVLPDPPQADVPSAEHALPEAHCGPARSADRDHRPAHVAAHVRHHRRGRPSEGRTEDDQAGGSNRQRPGGQPAHRAGLRGSPVPAAKVPASLAAAEDDE